MQSATLDTSCALNFLMTDEEPDDDLMDVISLALGGKIAANVSEEAFAEVEGTTDADARERRITRLKTFGRLEIPTGRVEERDEIAERLHLAIFPDATPGKQFVDKVKAEAEAAGLPSYPGISVRDADLEKDEGDIRRVLSPLAADYPNFDQWLTGALKKGGTRVRVGEHEGHVAAVALSQTKDPRVVKLSAFYVEESAQRAGLGGHLLWSELRTWARHDVEKVYVTVSSRHADLVAFFTAFGFLVEGMSPRRYQDDTAELVLGKHFIRERISDSELDDFAGKTATVVFGVPPGADAGPAGWGLMPDVERPDLEWQGENDQLRLLARAGAEESRSWRLLDLERIFHPVRFAVADRQVLMVPIEPRWADALLEHAGQQRSLGQDAASERLLLRADNAYYCYPKLLDIAQPGTPILFYVSAPISAVVGEARIYESAVDVPEELFAAFGGLGIYRLSQIRSHVMPRGPRKGKALAMRFGMYVPFEQTVPPSALERIAGCRRVPQGLLAISFEEFEEIRRTGGLEW